MALSCLLFQSTNLWCGVAQVGVWLCICRAMKLRSSATSPGIYRPLCQFCQPQIRFLRSGANRQHRNAAGAASVSVLCQQPSFCADTNLDRVTDRVARPRIAYAIPLILFPRSERVVRSIKPNQLMRGCCAAFALFFVALSIHAYKTLSAMPYEILKPEYNLLPLSVGVAALILFAALNALTGYSAFSPRMLARAFARVPFVRYFAVACVALVYFKLRKLSSGDWASVNLEPLLYCIQGTQRPLQFLIGHAMHYGPLFITLCLLFKPFCKQVQKLGLGLLYRCRRCAGILHQWREPAAYQLRSIHSAAAGTDA